MSFGYSISDPHQKIWKNWITLVLCPLFSESGLSQQTSTPTSKSNGGVQNGSPGSSVMRKSCLKQRGPMRSLSVGRSPRSRPVMRGNRRDPQTTEAAQKDVVFPQSLRFDSMCSIYPLSRRDSADRQSAEAAHSIAISSEFGEHFIRINAPPDEDELSLAQRLQKIWWIPERCTALRHRFDYSYFVFSPKNRWVMSSYYHLTLYSYIVLALQITHILRRLQWPPLLWSRYSVLHRVKLHHASYGTA